MLESGDKVLYVSGRHGANKQNPLAGTEFECEGIISIASRGGFIKVDWDNGAWNSYSLSDLASADDARLGKLDPNRAFSSKKRAKRGKER